MNENDFWVIGGTDRYYTNGLFMDVRYNHAPECGSLMRMLGMAIGMAEDCGATTDDTYGYGYSVGHLIFTPADIEDPEPQFTDRPWAGYLYGAVSFQRDHTVNDLSVYDTLDLQLGVIGEVSGAAGVQIKWHKFIGEERPNGWDNQLPDEPAFLVKFKREWPAWREWRVTDFDTHLRLRPFIEGQAGTVALRAKAGLETRIGHNMKDDPLRGDWSAADKPTWFAFMNVNGSAVAHNIFLASNVFRNSLSVPQKHFVAELKYGVTVQWKRFFLTFSEIWQSKEFSNQPKGHRYGAVRLTWYY